MAVLRWRTPRLRSEEEAQEAKVTSVDLFYDLVFAVVVAQLATALSGDLTLHGFLVFALLFVAVASNSRACAAHEPHPRGDGVLPIINSEQEPRQPEISLLFLITRV